MMLRAAEELPLPLRGRWQPLRAGLVDLFYYDYQEFWFRDGRLMLLGNNGTGKSKVLALTLPFLLDANLSPTRVEPDGDRDKKMEWNLLLGGKYDERLGYVWLEFGRRAEDGEHAYFTIGCGLKAVAGRGVADHWYFTTSQRIGADMHLIGPGGAALTRDRLTAAVGEFGMVTQGAETYRRAVDEHLLHLARTATGRWSTCWYSFASRSCRRSRTRASCPGRCRRRWPRSTSRWSPTSPPRSTISSSSVTNWRR